MCTGTDCWLSRVLGLCCAQPALVMNRVQGYKIALVAKLRAEPGNFGRRAQIGDFCAGLAERVWIARVDLLLSDDAPEHAVDSCPKLALAPG